MHNNPRKSSTQIRAITPERFTLSQLALEVQRLRPIDSVTAREITDLQDEVKRLIELCEEGNLNFVNAGIQLVQGRINTILVVLNAKKE